MSFSSNNIYDTHVSVPMKKCGRCGYWIAPYEQQVKCSICTKLCHRRCFKEHRCEAPKPKHPALKYARNLGI